MWLGNWPRRRRGASSPAGKAAPALPWHDGSRSFAGRPAPWGRVVSPATFLP
uniref:Uncharacterized protein n=1 Tax=Aegilops tauschii subsp. strangulata TaxID=200361 RepID=A0A452ZBQ1_AEGTS